MEPAEVTCPHCGREVPRENYCVACGEPLAGGARGFAANPHERWYHPRLVSSIFPHLPRGDMRPFRIALLVAGAVVIVLCLLRLYPLALVAAAVAVPLLFVVYFRDVDLYEDEPVRVVAFTIVWGAVAGVGLGFAARHLATQASLFQGEPSTHDIVWLGAILPCAALALALAGPLILLPYRKFNDTLDGVTFGACSAATLGAAEVITNSADFLHLGFRAAGDQALWIARLTTLGIAMPVLAAGVVGATCGSFWLRFRGPEGDRRALGAFGSPLLAVPLAAAALVGASLSSLYLDQWATLAITAALALTGLVWLRWMIQLGLREEAAEKPIGPPIECPSCHHETPAHTFCGNCGVGLRALPKHPQGSRMRPAVKLAAFGALSAAAIGLTALAILLTRPSPPKPTCEPGVPCASPPKSPVAAPQAVAAVFQTGVQWTSDLGPGLRYPKHWDVVTSGKRTLVVKGENGQGLFVVLAVNVRPSSRTPLDALKDQVSSERGGSFLGVDADNSAKHAVVSPEIGYVHGVSAVYKATVDQPPSPSAQVELAFMAARRGNATVVVEAITNQGAQSGSANSPFPAFEVVDSILTSFTWGTPPT